MTSNNYTASIHRHNFACWASGRASSVINQRFSVSDCKRALEISGFNPITLDEGLLPNVKEFDVWHRNKRQLIIKNLKGKITTHGVAAKIINVYLKTLYLCGHQPFNEQVRVIHPPIDSLLLESLYKNNVGNLKHQWKIAKNIRWSKLNSKEYEDLIVAIKSVTTTEKGLWSIEEYWQGYQ